MAPDAELGPVLKSFGGRLYFNLSQLRHVCRMGGYAPAAMLRSLGHSEAISAEDEIAVRPPVVEFVLRLPDFARLAARHMRASTNRPHPAGSHRGVSCATEGGRSGDARRRGAVVDNRGVAAAGRRKCRPC